MGRKPKIVRSADDLDRRESGYYSTPTFVANFFAARILELAPTAKTVFDPCIGRGELTIPFKERGLSASGCDILDMSPLGCDHFAQSDFLETLITDESTPLLARAPRTEADVIVANPPYNCHEIEYIRANKPRLIKRFGKSTVLNMYSLFVRGIIEYAAEGCLIGLITHDSFLTATGHQDLRRYISETCTILNLHLCPTDLFLDQGADVRTCLLVLRKTPRCTDEVQVSNRPATTSEFKKILNSRCFSTEKFNDLVLLDSRDNCEIAIGVPPEIRRFFDGRRLAEIAPCLTGISTGNDKKYISSVRSAEFDMPFYKNPASRRFFAPPDGFLRSDYEAVSKEVPNFMIRNKDLMFRGGISCSSMGVKFGAAMRPDNTACGVNPNIIIEDDRKWWLLSFLNSKLCFYMTRGIIIRGNMITAGYASRIPVPEMSSAALLGLANLGREGFALAEKGKAWDGVVNEIDALIAAELGLSDDIRTFLAEFDSDPIRLA